MRNDVVHRNSTIIAGGWNSKFMPNEKLTLELDLGYSRLKKTEENLEIYLGTGRGAGVGARETALGFEMRPNGGIMFDPSLDYADPDLFVITDPQGWNSCGGAVANCQDGFVNTPRIKDELKSLRVQATQELDGVISSLRVGANYSDRKKSLDDRGFVLTSKIIRRIPRFPPIISDDPVSLDFIGIPGMVAFDSWRFYNDGNYTLTDGARLRSGLRVFNDYTIREKVLTGFVQVEFQRRCGQHPDPRQRRRPDRHSDRTGSSFYAQVVGGVTQSTPVTDGASQYTDILPEPEPDGRVRRQHLPALRRGADAGAGAHGSAEARRRRQFRHVEAQQHRRQTRVALVARPRQCAAASADGRHGRRRASRNISVRAAMSRSAASTNISKITSTVRSIRSTSRTSRSPTAARSARAPGSASSG